jgi:hypothetical protein
VSTAAAHETPRNPWTIVSGPAPETLLCNDPSPGCWGTEEPVRRGEENRRSRLPSGRTRELGARVSDATKHWRARAIANPIRKGSSRPAWRSFTRDLGAVAVWVASVRLSSDASLVSEKCSVARLGRRGERNEWRHCKQLCQPAHRSYTSVRRPPSTILRMRGARPPPGLPPGGEAATGAPPALASPGRSREAATVRTHAYPNRQVDRQGRGGGRAPAGHANKQPAGRPQPEPDPYSPSQQTWPALIRCREAARRWSSLSW